MMQHERWYAKVAFFSASAGAAMEFCTGFYEKVGDLEAQRRADELQAAKEQLDASAMLWRQQQQQWQTNFASREGTTTPVDPIVILLSLVHCFGSSAFGREGTTTHRNSPLARALLRIFSFCHHETVNATYHTDLCNFLLSSNLKIPYWHAESECHSITDSGPAGSKVANPLLPLLKL